MLTCTFPSRRAVALLFLTLTLPKLPFAQTGPNCPLSGPLYPTPVQPQIGSTILPRAIQSLEDGFKSAIENGTLSSANTSFHVSVFSTNETLFEFNYEAPATKEFLTSGTLNRDTMFLSGSIGKFMTVYSLLAATGLQHINDPITKWVPELANAVFENEVNTERWEEITIKALASHMAGVRDFSIGDLSVIYNASTAEEFGLPVLQPSEILTCGTDIHLPACSRSDFFSQFQRLHPVSSAFNMPIYSNVAWQILAYAIEAITNKTFAENFEATLKHPLNLTGTFATPVPITPSINAIIPGGEIESGWKLDLGDGSSVAEGIFFTTGADLSTLGRSVLSSSLLERQLTRQWLKPTAHSADLRMSVGMPWEILRIEVPSPSSLVESKAPPKPPTRIVDLYLKNGGLGAYNTQFALSPDHGLGFVVLTAGQSPSIGPDLRFPTMQLINKMITETMVPAFEAAAQQQAAKNFAGRYGSSGNDSIPMALEVVAGDGGLGLGVRNWTGGQLDLLKSYVAAMQGSTIEDLKEEPSLRLYPVDLRDASQVAFRGVYESYTEGNAFSTSETRPFEGYCAAWGGVSEPQYGNVGLDDFVFTIDQEGKAISVDVRGARRMLLRKG